MDEKIRIVSAVKARSFSKKCDRKLLQNRLLRLSLGPADFNKSGSRNNFSRTIVLPIKGLNGANAKQKLPKTSVPPLQKINELVLLNSIKKKN